MRREGLRYYRESLPERDGFQSGTVGEEDFRRLCQDLEVAPEITEVDGSSLFCVLRRS